MAEKILALLIVFFGGITLTMLVGTKLINLALRHSPPARRLLRDKLDREDARHALVGVPATDSLAHGFNAGVEAGIREGKCELCIDPIDLPHVDEDGARRWRACPNLAARTVEHSGHKLRVCEEHFQAGTREAAERRLRQLEDQEKDSSG